MSTGLQLRATSGDPSVFLLRRILPIVIVLTLLTGFLRWVATEKGLFSDRIGVVIMTAFATAVFCSFAVWAARALRAAAEVQRTVERDTLYRLLANNIPGGGIFLFDRDLRYVLAEGQNFRMVGLDRAALEGKTIWEALEPEVAKMVEPAYRAALMGEDTVFEMGFRDHTYLVTVAPTYADGGEVVGGLVHTQEITVQKELEEQLRQSQKLEAVGALAGGVAHDFNNLLTVMTGYASLALGNLDEQDAGRLATEQILLAAQRATTLTQQLLAFSRKQVLLPQVIDVNRVVEGLLPMLRSLIETRIELTTHLQPDVGAVLFDPGRLEQVIVNLVVNARDAIAGAGTIAIETSEVDLDADYAASHADVQTGRHVALVVADTGKGFDQATSDRLFEPFFTTKPPDSGTGLGLSTVHGIVKQSGGNIWVYSEPGRGATFKIYLPIVDESVAPTSTSTQRTTATRAFAGARILLVEDNEAVLRLTMHVLGDAGYALTTATSVGEAIAALQQQAFDLIVTDLVMPGGTGEQIARTTDADGGRPPVIFMSGYTEATMSRDDLLANRGRFIEKPFTPAALLALVAETLATAAY